MISANRSSVWRNHRGQGDHETAGDLALTLNGGDELATNAYRARVIAAGLENRT
jgi:hypothetical protein